MSIISVGWDPGLFSLNRLLGHVVCQRAGLHLLGSRRQPGHSDAIRRIPGVRRAVQYTLPVDSALEKVRDGSNPDFSAREKHTRLCYVVIEDNASAAYIETAVKTMPNYFADYDTEVKFITEEEFDRDHAGIPHGGFKHPHRAKRFGRQAENGICPGFGKQPRIHTPACWCPLPAPSPKWPKRAKPAPAPFI